MKFHMEKTHSFKTDKISFLISQSFNHQVHDVKIINSYRSDYRPIILQLKLNDFILGRDYGNLKIHFHMRWIMLKLLKKLLK
jgi:hypothetical protein